MSLTSQSYLFFLREMSVLCDVIFADALVGSFRNLLWLVLFSLHVL